jgi:hypothetical protein
MPVCQSHALLHYVTHLRTVEPESRVIFIPNAAVWRTSPTPMQELLRALLVAFHTDDDTAQFLCSLLACDLRRKPLSNIEGLLSACLHSFRAAGSVGKHKLLFVLDQHNAFDEADLTKFPFSLAGHLNLREFTDCGGCIILAGSDNNKTVSRWHSLLSHASTRYGLRLTLVLLRVVSYLPVV